MTDTLPAGTTLDDPYWSDNGDGTATRTIAGPIAPGRSDHRGHHPRCSTPTTLPGPSLNTAEISPRTTASATRPPTLDSTPTPSDPTTTASSTT